MFLHLSKVETKTFQQSLKNKKREHGFQEGFLKLKWRVFLKYELKYILGVVLNIDMGMRVHINSSLYVNHVDIMGIKGSYFLDDHVSLASGSTRLRMFYATTKYRTILEVWARRSITT